MICPKCGFEQPDSPECARCGVIVNRYKGPALGASALRPPAVRPASPPAAFGVPEPMAASAVGTVFGGPEPAMAGGGTVYNGPPPGSAAAAAMAAPRILAQPRGTLGVGDVLGKTFSIYFSNLLPFLLLTAIALTPFYLAQAWLFSAKSGASPASLVLACSSLLVSLGSLLCVNIATGAITYGVFQQMRNQDTSIGDCLSRGLSALPRVVGLAIGQGLCIVVGLLLFIIPGILLAVRWAVSVPAAVTEGSGVSDSMSRSSELTEGFRGEVFGVLLVFGVLNFGSIFLVALVAAKNPTLTLTLSAVKDLFSVGLTATGSAVMYYRLRSAKESIDVDQIASVFD